jgi:glutathione S-transferase
MKPARPPRFETRRAKELEAELFARARAWIPSWGMDDDERDFGRALLKVAARFSSEVAERLDRAGDKLRLGFLDWLAVPAEAARPARLPVVFKLADSARDAKPAAALTRLQVEAASASVVLETETEVLVLPRQLQLLVGVDAGADAFFLPPPGLSSLAPLEPLPTQWQLKSFASAGATTLQLDPEQGLVVDMLIELGGLQYRITEVKKNIVTVEPPLTQDQPEQSIVTKVTAFMPFDGAARNRQEHALYIGHKELFNIEAAATIEIVGAKQLAEVAWHYWGKVHPADEIGWQPLQPGGATEQAQAEGLVLTKPKGAMEMLELVKGSESRWIRASAGTVKADQPPLLVDAFEIRINCTHGAPLPSSADASAAAPAAEAMANTTPLVLDSVFFPFGKEPRQFDTFYLGSKEAFSKKGADVVLDFEMADSTFTALAAVSGGAFADPVLAGVAQDGALYLLQVKTDTGVISQFRERGPLRPPVSAGGADVSVGVSLDRRPPGRPPLWHDAADPGGFLIATSARDAVWVWSESSSSKDASHWIPFGTVPTTQAAPTASISDLVYLTDTSTLVALRGGQLSVRKWQDAAPWMPVKTEEKKTEDKNSGKPVVLDAIVPILTVDGSLAVTDMLGISSDKKLYQVSVTGVCTPLDPTNVDASVRPIALRQDGNLFITFLHASGGNPVMFHSSEGGGESEVDLEAKVMGFDATISKDGGLTFLASVQQPAGGALAWWPASTADHIKPALAHIPAGLGQPAGAPTTFDGRVVIPGTGGHLLAAADVSAEAHWLRSLDDTSTNPELSWEYWNGTGWWKLVVTRDETLNLRISGKLGFKVPTDLAPTDWSGRTNYWIRARLIGGDYGREKVSVAISKRDKQTHLIHQTIERSTEDIHPPSVVRIGISYEICESVLPMLVMTKDSGSLRDQSDANRTAGAKVDAFVPVAVLLGRLSGPPPAAAAHADCCKPTADSKPAADSTATSSLASGRALYLGFDAPLLGEPINVLLLVEERAHDAFAPMTVEVLIADRFVPVSVNDETRALGESGVLSMAFPVEATPRELFGRTLRWLRLTPAAGTSSADWKPKVRGAYLNGVWASAAETLTRELVGSSQGEPQLTLYLARPPVLRNTLELRVKEPLGEEERDALNLERADQVLSAVENLPGDWVLWQRVIDPADAEPTARVYALDDATGEIRFGDGRHGRIPPVGRDSIVAFKYRRTEPGPPENAAVVPGNTITARTALNLVSPIEGVEAVFAADQGAGGAPPEGVDRVLQFGVASLRHRRRALTVRDIEDLVLESSPDIAQARCFARNGFIQLVAVMRGANPMPSAAQLRELQRLLVAEAPPALSARQALRIGGPTLRRLRVDLRLRVASLDIAGAVGRDARQRISALFDTATGGAAGEGWALGENPSEADIAVALTNAPRLEGIATVALREITADGSDQQWPQSLKRNELARLERDGVRIEFETVEVVA